MQQRIRVLMCGSDVRCVKGGMVTVVRNYLGCTGWQRSRLRYLPTHTEGSAAKKALYFAGAYLRVCGLLLAKRADLVHLHVAERGSFYRKSFLVWLCRRQKVPVILHHHGAEFEDFYAKLGERQKRYVRKVLEAADCNLFLSEFLRRKMLEKAPGAKTAVLHNAVEASGARAYRLQARRIVMLGRQGWRKGSFDLLEAMAEIDRELPPEVTLWMCGDGDLEEVRRKAEALGVAGRLEHLGWIDGGEKESCLAEAMVHVLPSYREGLPMSILETMGRGIPNISTRIASIPEVIRDGVTGFLMEPGEADRLAELLLRLAKDGALRERLSEAGYRLISEEFSLKKHLAVLEKIYEELVADAFGGTPRGTGTVRAREAAPDTDAAAGASVAAGAGPVYCECGQEPDLWDNRI